MFENTTNNVIYIFQNNIEHLWDGYNWKYSECWLFQVKSRFATSQILSDRFDIKQLSF